VDFGDDGTADASFDRATSQIRHPAAGRRRLADQVNGARRRASRSRWGRRRHPAGGDGAEHCRRRRRRDDRATATAATIADPAGPGQLPLGPGDGSDIDGQSGHDTLDFNGAGANDDEPVAQRHPLVVPADVANIRTDMDDVELRPFRPRRHGPSRSMT
jgi:hypothetical protein